MTSEVPLNICTFLHLDIHCTTTVWQMPHVVTVGRLKDKLILAQNIAFLYFKGTRAIAEDMNGSKTCLD